MKRTDLTELIVKNLVLRGYDEQIARLSLQILDPMFVLSPSQVEQSERESLILRRGKRYLQLGLKTDASRPVKMLWAMAARDDFSAVINQDSADLGYLAHYYRGFTYTYTPLLDDERALDDFDQALLNPKQDQHAVVYYHRSILHIQRGAFKEAVADAEQAHEMDPSNKDYAAVLMHAQQVGGEHSK